VYKQISDMCLRHHRTKKHLEPDYANTFMKMANSILVSSKLWQRHATWKLEGDIWIGDFTLYNDDHDMYAMVMEFPVQKWARIYKLKQLGI
jgi:hypothetical protein